MVLHEGSTARQRAFWKVVGFFLVVIKTGELEAIGIQ